MSDIQCVLNWLDENGKDSVINFQQTLTSIPALSPENGGDGEENKARAIEQILHTIGVHDIQYYDSPDSRVPNGKRPNIVARIEGNTPRTLWIMGHIDVVPAGDLSKWNTNPWEAIVQDDCIYGRGTEDNQQAIVSMLVLAKALKACSIKPNIGLGMLFVADEECGSIHGMEYVMRTARDLFRTNDLVLVPDMGSPDGSIVEVAEKGILWIRVEVCGKSCHASRPQEGINTLPAAAEMILCTSDIAKQFTAQDTLFDCGSTFTPTRHEENVSNVNSVPGRDVFYIDCRILPCYTFDEVMYAFEKAFGAIAIKYGVTVSLSRVQDTPSAPTTSVQSPVVQQLCSSIQKILGVKPHCIGVGGGTVASVFRRAGIEAAVWGTQDGSLHAPNEYSRISYTLGNAKVFADMLLEENR